jgi:hypothetical protein
MKLNKKVYLPRIFLYSQGEKMVEFFLSAKHPHIFYSQYSHRITTEDAVKSHDFFVKNFSKESIVISIIEILPETSINDVNFIKYAARNTNSLDLHMQEEYIFGLNGVQKYFLQIYASLISRQNHEIHITDYLYTLEEKYGFSFQNDFQRAEDILVFGKYEHS